MTDTHADSYLTLASSCTHEIKIKGSRFIGLGYPAADEGEAIRHLETIRKKEHAATHHCFAWVVGLEDGIFKYSDDGEPTGTAGRPIYNVIVGRELKNVIVIVVRYYGGTKLGTGGLTRAYTQAAAEMLDGADIVERLICDRLQFSIPFTYYDRLMRLINQKNYTIESQDFGEQVAMVLQIRKSQTESFVTHLKELTGGRVDIIING
jgi:uncharacterized YigZ family protein